MDCGNDYIKMCDCREIQNVWFVRQGGIPDLAFIRVGGHYKRSIISKGVIKGRESISHFEWNDYSITNPEWFKAIGGVVGRRTIIDGSTGENFIDLDETFPMTRQLLLESFQNISNEQWYRIEDCIWLPRQDQLQGMIQIKDSTIKSQSHRLVQAFYRFCIIEIGYSLGSVFEERSYTEQFTSMEQLWLAFVMDEKYNKVWSGAEWVNEDIKG